MRDGIRDKSQNVSQMFAHIAGRYDLMNAIMSVGQDRSWRRLAANLAAPNEGDTALDLATGTGDLALELAQRARSVVGLDLCREMMEFGMDKAAKAGLASKITFLMADALAIPFHDNTFQCATVAFGVRNMEDIRQVFQEMRRVVKPGGRVVCLEIVRPPNGLWGALYRLYLNRAVPIMGRWVARDGDAYGYLAQSVFRFFSPGELAQIMEAAGLQRVEHTSLNFGTVAIHRGFK